MKAEKGSHALLSDQSLTDEKEDRFSHSTYVDVILDVISHCDTPHHIGMFGKWGTGKSTILNFIKIRMNERKDLNDRYNFFCLDSWKLSKESFRQQLLESLNEHFGNKVKNIEDKLWNLQEIGKQIEIQTSPIAWASLVILVAIALAGPALKFFLRFDVLDYLMALIPLALIAPLIQALQNISRTSLTLMESSKRIIPRIESPRQFEQLFKEIIENRGKKTLVIAIDNLDRCESKLAVEILGTIKTFMDVKGCVYIVACDDEALERHVAQETHTTENEDARTHAKEFLRKFFQTNVKIAPFLEGSLQRFSQEQNLKLPRPFDNDVIFVVTAAFKKSPRRIKQFLNNLYAVRLTCELREKIGVIRPGQITTNFAFMTKILVVRDEWPDFYARLDDRSILTRVENHFRGAQEADVKAIVDRNPELRAFLQATRRIGSDDVETFLIVSQESYESSISELERLKTWIITGEFESVRGRLSTAKHESEKESIADFTIKILQEHFRLEHKNEVTNILRVIAKTYGLISENKRITLADQFGNTISMAPYAENIREFSLDELFVILKDCSSIFRKEVLNKLIPLLKKDKALDLELIDALIKHHSIVDSETGAGIRAIIVEMYDGNQAPILQRLDQIRSQKEIAQIMVDSALLTKIANSMTNDQGDINLLRINVFQELRWLADDNSKALFIGKMLDLVCDPATNAIQPKVKIGLENLAAFDVSEVPTSSQDIIARRLPTACHAISDPKEKLAEMEVLFRLAQNMEKKDLDSIRSTLIDPTLQSAGPDFFLQVLTLCHKYRFSTFTEPSTMRTMLGRIQSNLQDINVIKYVIENTKGEQRKQVVQTLAGLIATTPPGLQAALTAIQGSKPHFNHEEIDEFCAAALTRSKNVDHAVAVTLVNFAFQILDTASQPQKNAFVNHMVEYVKETAADRKKIGSDYYRQSRQLVEKTTRRAGMRSLILKLESDGSNFNQQTKVALDIIFEELEILGPDEARLQDLLRAAATDVKTEESRVIALDYIRQLALKKTLPPELEESLCDAAVSKNENISATALKALSLLKIKKLPSDIAKKLEEYHARNSGKNT
jgi:hypothetical protein